MAEDIRTNLRDKIILSSMLIFGVGNMVLMGLGIANDNILMAIVAGLFGIYKGLPTPPSEIRETTTTVSTTPASEPIAKEGKDAELSLILGKND
jgi:hypothetical protein